MPQLPPSHFPHQPASRPGAIRALALRGDCHKGAEGSQACHLAVDPGVWRDAPGRDGMA